MKCKYWYIKERHNPQFDKPYYQLLGNISQKRAISHLNPVYGTNYLLTFNNQEDYMKKIDELKSKGFDIH